MVFYVPLTYAERDVKGKTFYTMANIWYEKPSEIFSANYHRGSIIPVGTKVKIEKISGRGMTEWDYFDQYFSEENPMRKDGPFEKLSEDEKNNIRIGEINEGMSKSAVLMSYGYPPSHKTPSLKNDIWIYWVNRFAQRVIYFKDDKVIKIGRKL